MTLTPSLPFHPRSTSSSSTILIAPPVLVLCDGYHRCVSVCCTYARGCACWRWLNLPHNYFPIPHGTARLCTHLVLSPPLAPLPPPTALHLPLQRSSRPCLAVVRLSSSVRERVLHCTMHVRGCCAVLCDTCVCGCCVDVLATLPAHPVLAHTPPADLVFNHIHIHNGTPTALCIHLYHGYVSMNRSCSGYLGCFPMVRQLTPSHSLLSRLSQVLLSYFNSSSALSFPFPP